MTARYDRRGQEIQAQIARALHRPVDRTHPRSSVGPGRACLTRSTPNRSTPRWCTSTGSSGTPSSSSRSSELAAPSRCWPRSRNAPTVSSRKCAPRPTPRRGARSPGPTRKVTRPKGHPLRAEREGGVDKVDEPCARAFDRPQFTGERPPKATQGTEQLVPGPLPPEWQGHPGRHNTQHPSYISQTAAEAVRSPVERR